MNTHDPEMCAEAFATAGLHNGDPQHPLPAATVLPWARVAIEALKADGIVFTRKPLCA